MVIDINGTLGVIMAGIILIYMGDVTSVMGFAKPFATILLNATGSKAVTTVVISCFILLSLNGSITTITSVSRLTWAWAPNGGLPAYFTHIRPMYRILVRSVWLSVTDLAHMPAQYRFGPSSGFHRHHLALVVPV